MPSLSRVGVGLLIALVTACQAPLTPSFTVTFDAASAALKPGDAKDVTVTLQRLNEFTDPVTVTLAGLPAGVIASPATLAMKGTDSRATVRLQASATTAATSSKITAEGVSGAVRKSAALDLSVLSFNLTIDAAKLSLTQGDASDVTVTLERLNGFADPVTVTLKGLPADITASPATVTIAANAMSASLLLTASGTAAIASSDVTITGISGTVQKSAALQLATIKPDPSKPDVFVKRLEWGQSVLKSDLRLVAGKAAVLRAFVNATQAGMTGVIVRATATVNGATVGTLNLTAPSSIPVTDTDTSLASTYWGVLPKDWIKSGLEVKLEVDAGRTVSESNEANNAQVLKPAVGSSTKLYLTMVPLIVDGKPAMAFDAAAAAALKTGLMSFWPLADIDLQIRAPYTVKAVGSNWGAVLNEVSGLRNADNSKRYYYGFYAIGGGIGYVGYPVGAGLPDLRVTAHELGHTFGQLHAPCGNPDSVDPDYPTAYKNGSIGSWGIDPSKNTLVDPAKYTDVMSYCGPNWISDFMYRKVQLFLEARPSVESVDITASDLLLVSGTVTNGQITLEPIQRITGVFDAPESGLYNLSLETASGLKQVSFDLHKVTHEDGTGRLIDNASFSFTMPDPGSISKVTVSGYSVAKLEQSAKVTPARVQSVKPTSVQRSGSRVTVTWDAAVYSSVAVAHIAPDGTRTTLALGLTGGTATLELGALGAGQFEVSASDGLNGFKQRF